MFPFDVDSDFHRGRLLFGSGDLYIIRYASAMDDVWSEMEHIKYIKEL